MTNVRPATAAESRAWMRAYASRRAAARRAMRVPEAEIARAGESFERLWGKAPESVLLVVEDAGTIIGYAAAARLGGLRTSAATVAEIWIEPGHRRAGLGTLALQGLSAWARARGMDRLEVTIDPRDPAQEGFYAPGGGWAGLTQHRARFLDSEPRLPAGARMRPMRRAEFDAWLEPAIASFAGSLEDTGVSPADALERARAAFAELLPDGLATAGHVLRAVEVDETADAGVDDADVDGPDVDGPDVDGPDVDDAGRRVGLVWVHLHHRGDQAFVYDLMVDEAQRGKGFGAALCRACDRIAWDAGDRVVDLNVFTANTPAIRLYERQGYQAYEESRALDLT